MASHKYFSVCRSSINCFLFFSVLFYFFCCTNGQELSEYSVAIDQDSASSGNDSVDNLYKKAAQIIELDSEGTPMIIQSTAEIMKKIHGLVNVVAVIGNVGTGKSRLANFLAGKDVFPIADYDNKQSGTKGVWAYAFSNEMDGTTLLLDTEGFFRPGNTEQHDQALFSFIALASSHIFYCTQSVVNNAETDFLEKAIRNTRLHFESAISEELPGPLPSFTWIRQDADSNSDDFWNTEKTLQWISAFFEPSKRRDGSKPDQNFVREAFPNSTLVTLKSYSPPMALEGVEEFPQIEVNQRIQSKGEIIADARLRKTISLREMSKGRYSFDGGQTLLAAFESSIAAIRNGISSINLGPWRPFLEKQARLAMIKSSKIYDISMSRNRKIPPMRLSSLEVENERCTARALANFNALMWDAEECQGYIEQLRESFKFKFEKILGERLEDLNKHFKDCTNDIILKYERDVKEIHLPQRSPDLVKLMYEEDKIAYRSLQEKSVLYENEPVTHQYSEFVNNKIRDIKTRKYDENRNEIRKILELYNKNKLLEANNKMDSWFKSGPQTAEKLQKLQELEMKSIMLDVKKINADWKDELDYPIMAETLYGNLQKVFALAKDKNSQELQKYATEEIKTTLQDGLQWLNTMRDRFPIRPSSAAVSTENEIKVMVDKVQKRLEQFAGTPEVNSAVEALRKNWEKETDNFKKDNMDLWTRTFREPLQRAYELSEKEVKEYYLPHSFLERAKAMAKAELEKSGLAADIVNDVSTYWTDKPESDGIKGPKMLISQTWCMWAIDQRYSLVFYMVIFLLSLLAYFTYNRR